MKSKEINSFILDSLDSSIMVTMVKGIAISMANITAIIKVPIVSRIISFFMSFFSIPNTVNKTNSLASFNNPFHIWSINTILINISTAITKY